MIKVKPDITIKYLATLLILAFWPLNFILNNKEPFLWVLYLLAFFLLAGFYFFNKANKLWILFALSTVIVFGFMTFGKNIQDNSIFYYSRDDDQNVIREGYLYPNVWMSRMFQNKPSIYWNRLKFNAFALTDPGNYFFGFHPREITVDNQNLQKFPALSLVFLLFGLFYMNTNRNRVYIAVSMIPLLTILLFMKNFDRYDFILFFPLSLIILNGLRVFISNPNKIKSGFLIIFGIYSVIEYIQLLINASLKQ